MSCSMPGERLSAYVDDLLEAEERAETVRHIAQCRTCARLVAALQEERDALRAALAPDWTPAAREPAEPRGEGWRRFAAAAALVLAASLTTIALDRMLRPEKPEGWLPGLNLTKVFTGPKRPRVLIGIIRQASSPRVRPASFVIQRDSLDAAEDIEL